LSCQPAFATIRDNRLYQPDYYTFEASRGHKWDYGRRCVDQLISAAQVVTHLRANSSHGPEHETQVRPLVGLAPEAAQQAWTRALELAADRPISARLVQAAVKELLFRGPSLESPQPALPRRVEQITEFEVANAHLEALRLHRNIHETHHELRMTPQKAWDAAQSEKRSILRPTPRCPWWPYIWSARTTIKVGSDGRVPIGTQRLRVERCRGESRFVPPSRRPPFRPGCAPRPKRETRPSFHQSPKMTLSCFANYKKLLV
jgi:hypothetical protein